MKELRTKALEKYNEKQVDEAIRKIKGKNLKTAIIISGIILLVIIASVIVYLQAKKPITVTEAQKKFEECNKTAYLYCSAMISPDIQCNEDIMCKNMLKINLAITTNNASVCDELNIQCPSCSDSCRAFVLKDAAYCDKLQSPSREECKIFISAKQNPDLCSTLVDTAKINLCMLFSTHNLSYCEDYVKNTCGIK